MLSCWRRESLPYSPTYGSVSAAPGVSPGQRASPPPPPSLPRHPWVPPAGERRRLRGALGQSLTQSLAVLKAGQKTAGRLQARLRSIRCPCRSARVEGGGEGAHTSGRERPRGERRSRCDRLPSGSQLAPKGFTFASPSPRYRTRPWLPSTHRRGPLHLPRSGSAPPVPVPHPRPSAAPLAPCRTVFTTMGSLQLRITSNTS